MYKVGVIGCGWVGLAHGSGYKLLQDCEIVGSADPVKELSQHFAAKYGGRIYKSMNDLIDKEKPDIISVCTPPSSHYPVIKTALSRGIKNIVCEKPLAHNTADARKIVRAIKESSAKLMTAFCHRFIFPVMKMRWMIDSGELGDIVFFRNEFSSHFKGVEDRWFSKKEISGGGSMMDTSVHSIDLFRFLCGEVKNVSARITQKMPGISVEDSCCVLVQSEKGAMGIIEASWNLGVGSAFLEVCGTKGRVQYEYWGEFRVRHEGDKEWKTIPVERDINRRFEDELHHFIRVLKGEEELRCSGDDGLRANQIIQAAYESVKQQKWVEV